jgi:septum formation protein
MRQFEKLVLASGSAARLALLEAAGLRVTVAPADVDEDEIKRRFAGLSVETVAAALADAKASHAARLTPEALVIGADQILVCDGRRFDKPRSTDEARSHLVALRGREHRLVSAAVCRRGRERLWLHVASPSLAMRDFSDAFLDDYLAAEGMAAKQTVGAYRLEGLGIRLFERVEGEHGSILGLPMLPLLSFLQEAGVLAA